MTPRPTQLEDGLTCALRAGIPVVEDGPEVLDPFQPWLSGRVDGGDGGDLVASCREAIDRAQLRSRDELRSAAALILAESGVDPDVVTWTIDRHRERVVVRASGPPLDEHTRSRLAVRALDVFRGIASRRDRIDVSYHATEG